MTTRSQKVSLTLATLLTLILGAIAYTLWYGPINKPYYPKTKSDIKINGNGNRVNVSQGDSANDKQDSIWQSKIDSLTEIRLEHQND